MSRGNARSLYRDAEQKFATFHQKWSVEKGGSREDAVAAALAADDAIELLWPLVYSGDLSPEEAETMEGWLSLLAGVPDVEKGWLGAREYREEHRVKVKPA
ncbi:MAG: hypothetical protein NUW01_02790 [Gemmatimonadaceae bacterium]|nr:hypothetical protein [Gemmatimonadaceae bacterium]